MSTALLAQLQGSCDSGQATGPHSQWGLSDLSLIQLLSVWPGSRSKAPVSHHTALVPRLSCLDVHSFNKYLLSICVMVLFQALELQEGINKQESLHAWSLCSCRGTNKTQALILAQSSRVAGDQRGEAGPLSRPVS